VKSAAERDRARKKYLLINSALVLASLAIAAVLAEVALRVIGFSAPVLWTYDDVTGSKLYPGASGWQREEGEAYITISSGGLRDREYSRRKPENTFRVAILGDSMTEALQVPLEYTFTSVLAQRLKHCKALGGREVEVMNFGVSGYGTAQELLAFRHRAAGYDPDLTVLAFYAGNDVRNNSKELEPSKLRPFYGLKDGNLVLDNGFLRAREYLALKKNFDERRTLFDLRIFQLARKLKSVLERRRESGGIMTREAGIEPGLNDAVFTPPTLDAWKEAWRLSERLIVALRDEVVGRGGRFLVVTIPIGIQVHPDPEVRKRFMHALRVDDLWYPDSRILALARAENIDMVNVGRALESYSQRNRRYLHGFSNTRFGTGHLNEIGHQLVGEALADHLCQHAGDV